MPTDCLFREDAYLTSAPATVLGLTDKGGDWRGEIYDPRRGKTFKSVVSRNADGTLNVKGCLAFICQTQLWRPAR